MRELGNLNLTAEEMDKALSLLRNVQANVRDTFLRRVYADFLNDIGAHDLAAKQRRLADCYDWLPTKEPIRVDLSQPEKVRRSGLQEARFPATVSIWYEWRPERNGVLFPFHYEIPCELINSAGDKG